MKLRSFALAVMVAAALGACTTIGGWLGNGSGTPAQANTAYAAEQFYTAGDKAALGCIHTCGLDAATLGKMRDVENEVYADLVKIRTAAEAGNSALVATELIAFNKAWGLLTGLLAQHGVTVAVPPQNSGG